MKNFIYLLCLFFFAYADSSFSANKDPLRQLPLLDIHSLKYAGGFRLPSDRLGESSASYAEGIITLGKGGRSIYMVGHSHQQAIGEFSIPELVKSQNHKDFNFAKTIQEFSKVLDRPESGNPEKVNRIGGMEYIAGQLYVNTYIFYDAGGKGKHTTLILKNAADLAKSPVAGYHSYSYRAHASGWLSPVPKIWQQALGGTYITGSSTGKPIVSRLSLGPSAFTFDPLKTNWGDAKPSKIKLNRLLDYPLSHPMGYKSGEVSDYLYNRSKKEGMWTHNSGSVYGFVVPGTRTYMTLGPNGGGESGIGYKITQDNGYHCGGHCPFKSDDFYNYFWLFDINDMRDVRAGKLKPERVLPYAHGKFPNIYPTDGINDISGAVFDYDKNILYMTLSRGDRLQYGWVPTVVAFKIEN